MARGNVQITISISRKHLDFVDTMAEEKRLGRSRTIQWLMDMAANYLAVLAEDSKL